MTFFAKLLLCRFYYVDTGFREAYINDDSIQQLYFYCFQEQRTL